MPNFAICRIKKLKSRANISGMSSHVDRSRETLNADPNIKNIVNHGSGNQLQDYDKRMAELAIPKIRKNAVLAVDFMMTASPEFFKDQDGKIDNQKTGDFVNRTKTWLKEKFGDNYVASTVHIDEKTPHIHALIIPEKDGKLNARHYFGGKEKMQKLQDDFHHAVEDLGLERGQKGSKAKHESIQKYYSKINEVEKISVEKDQLEKENKAIKKVLTRSQVDEIRGVEAHNQGGETTANKQPTLKN